jgi:hypothetical protein
LSEVSLTVGKDIPWYLVKNMPLLVYRFTTLAKMVQGRVVSRGAFNLDPFALIEVNAPLRSEQLTIPIEHSTDFQHLWEIFEERGVSEDEEVVMFYTPNKFMPNFKPRFQIIITSKGLAEKLHIKSSSDVPISDTMHIYQRYLERLAQRNATK